MPPTRFRKPGAFNAPAGGRPRSAGGRPSSADRGREKSGVDPKPSDTPRLEGTVVQVLGSQWEVLVGSQRYRCFLKRSIKDMEGLPVVGDVVEIDPPSGSSSRIIGAKPRRSVLRRPDPHRTQTDQVMVANIDQVVIVASVAAPPLNPWLVDRYLVATWKAGLEPLLCLTKIDLPVEPHIEAAVQTFVDIGVPVVRTCALTGEGMESLRERLEGRASAFVGQSGVGKTSLARALLDDRTLKVGEVNEATGRGRHTTTSARLLPLPGEQAGFLIDLPGQRVFGLAGLEPTDLYQGFPDLAALGSCAMPACRHQTEPGCAVRAAVDEGRLPERRVRAFNRILESLERDA